MRRRGRHGEWRWTLIHADGRLPAGLAIVLPAAGVVLSLALGGRQSERIALVAMPAGFCIAVAIAADIWRTRTPLHLPRGRLGAAARDRAARGRPVGHHAADHGGGDLRDRAVRARGFFSTPAGAQRDRVRHWPSGRC